MRFYSINAACFLLEIDKIDDFFFGLKAYLKSFQAVAPRLEKKELQIQIIHYQTIPKNLIILDGRKRLIFQTVGSASLWETDKMKKKL